MWCVHIPQDRLEVLMKSVTQKMTATKLEGSRIEKVFSLTPKKAKSKAAASAPKAAASAEAAPAEAAAAPAASNVE